MSNNNNFILINRNKLQPLAKIGHDFCPLSGECRCLQIAHWHVRFKPLTVCLSAANSSPSSYFSAALTGRWPGKGDWVVQAGGTYNNNKNNGVLVILLSVSAATISHPRNMQIPFLSSGFYRPSCPLSFRVNCMRVIALKRRSVAIKNRGSIKEKRQRDRHWVSGPATRRLWHKLKINVHLVWTMS